MIIVAFDPGLASTGWAVLDTDTQHVFDSGVIRTSAGAEKLERLFSLRQAVRAILQGYFQIEPTPQVAIEDFIFQKRTTKRGEEVPLPSAELLNRVVQVIVSECW
jgi:Holliday junction resolvasome RuvABC endonuclease subunit